MERPAWVTNEPQWLAHCREIVERSQNLLDGRLGVMQAGRELTSLGLKVRAEEDEDFRLFRMIDSESDVLPAGPERALWSATALEREDARIAAFEDNWRARAREAARSLILKYSVNDLVHSTTG